MLDRQIEEVVSNGNFYKQRIEQLGPEPRELDELDRRRVSLEAELSDATSEQGRLDALAQDSRKLKDEHARLRRRVGELEASLVGDAEAYDHARHEALAAEIRALEPLALQAERLGVVAGRGVTVVAELDSAVAERARTAGRRQELDQRLGALGYSEQAFNEARGAEAAADRARRDAELALVRARGESAAAAESRAGRGAPARRAGRARARGGGCRRRAGAASGARPRADRPPDRAQRDACGPISPSSRRASCATSPTAATPISSWTRTTVRRCSMTATPRRSSRVARRTSPTSRSGWPSVR